ncbi:MAG: RmuC family [Cyanobacteriota bacterium]
MNTVHGIKEQMTDTFKTQVGSLVLTERDLKQETSNLVKALRQPNSRGQWGEVILDKVLDTLRLFQSSSLEVN